ncbi:hypothetical protein ACSBR2_039632 [Camellia fascicularis]
MSHTLYQSQAGRNAQPHALFVTSWKERGTSCFIGHTSEGTQNLIYHTLYWALLRKEGGTYFKRHALPT